MEYSLHHAFKTYVTMIEHYHTLKSYREGAKIIRAGLPNVKRGEFGYKDIMLIKQFVEHVLVEDDELLELICEQDAVATIEALSSDAKKIKMTNTDAIKSSIFK